MISLLDGFSVRQDQPITLRESEPEPAIAVVRGAESDYWHVHPSTAALVIEVAITSLSLDREKAALYAEAGVEEYWIVIPRERKVEVYRSARGTGYVDRSSLKEGRLKCQTMAEISFQLEELFARV